MEATRLSMCWRYNFTIWTHSQHNLQQRKTKKQSSKYLHTMKFTAEWSMDMVTFLKPTVILDRDMINQITNSHGQLSLPIELPPTAVYYLIPLPSPPMVMYGMQYVGQIEDRVPTHSRSLTTSFLAATALG